MKTLAALLAIMMMLVASAATAIVPGLGEKSKTKTVLVGPGVKPPSSSTLATLKRLAHSTKIKGLGLRTKFGNGISADIRMRKRETGKASPNILGGQRGIGPSRGTGPYLGIKIKF
jgi:hypothetical protein